MQAKDADIMYIYYLNKSHEIDVIRPPEDFTIIHNRYGGKKKTVKVCFSNGPVFRTIPDNEGDVVQNTLWLGYYDEAAAAEHFCNNIIERQLKLHKEIDRLEKVVSKIEEQYCY